MDIHAPFSAIFKFCERVFCTYIFYHIWQDKQEKKGKKRNFVNRVFRKIKYLTFYSNMIYNVSYQIKYLEKLMTENGEKYEMPTTGVPKEMLRAQANVLLLYILEQGDNYVYGIIKQVKKVSNGEFEMNEATLYAIFKRLEKEGVIQSYWGNESEGGRRKYYHMTEFGRANMRLAGESWRKVNSMIVKIQSGNFNCNGDKGDNNE
jgi:DNA-binding PadR family transcriptional regulator